MSAADDDHERVAAVLARQAIEQLTHTVSVNGFPWLVPGETGYLMVPDLLVQASGWRRVDDLHFDPAPLLVAEIASCSTQKSIAAGSSPTTASAALRKYLLVDLPANFELHDFAAGTLVEAEGSIELIVGGETVRFSLPA